MFRRVRSERKRERLAAREGLFHRNEGKGSTVINGKNIGEVAVGGSTPMLIHLTDLDSFSRQKLLSTHPSDRNPPCPNTREKFV